MMVKSLFFSKKNDKFKNMNLGPKSKFRPKIYDYVRVRVRIYNDIHQILYSRRIFIYLKSSPKIQYICLKANK